MDFGVFDHLDRSGRPLAEYYEDRLKIVEAYDRTGFHAYHLAEHHSTPLGMAPSPSVFLAAVAERTRSLRFGTLVYALPLHHSAAAPRRSRSPTTVRIRPMRRRSMPRASS